MQNRVSAAFSCFFSSFFIFRLFLSLNVFFSGRGTPAALWVFVETIENGKKSQVLPPTSHSMASVYHDYKDEDNFLVSNRPK